MIVPGEVRGPIVAVEMVGVRGLVDRLPLVDLRDEARAGRDEGLEGECHAVVGYRAHDAALRPGGPVAGSAEAQCAVHLPALDRLALVPLIGADERARSIRRARRVPARLAVVACE